MLIQTKNFTICGDKTYTIKNKEGKVLAKEVMDFDYSKKYPHLLWIQESQGQSIIDYTGKALPAASRAEKCFLNEDYGTYCVHYENGKVQKHHFVPKEGESHKIADQEYLLGMEFLKLINARINQRG